MALFDKPSKPIVLVVMDGVGVAPPSPGNAVTLANTPNLDRLWPKYPHTTLEASGEYVGLPAGADGNSEVGHMTIGTGKILLQDLPRIDKKIISGEFMKNKEFLATIAHAKKTSGTIHLMGLLSHGLVHSSIKHLYQLIDFYVSHDWDPDKFLIHVITDGRDSSPSAGVGLIAELQAYLDRQRFGRISSVIGRYYAKDRDQRWDRIQKAYDLMVEGKGKKVIDISKAMNKSYADGVTDEYITGFLIPDHKNNLGLIKDGDALVNFDYRPDRALQITMAFEAKDFKGFERKRLENLYYVGFTNYKFDLPSHVSFPGEIITNTLGKILSENRIKQLRIAESEKFPHITYFFDGGKRVVYPGEDQVDVPSIRTVSTYDRVPAMSTEKIVDMYLEMQRKHKYGFTFINIASPDMVAHTGILEAAIRAMEATDQAVGRLADYVLKEKGALIITSDHGNCEELINMRTGEMDTKHSSNPVPIIIVKDGLGKTELQAGTLADIAPTILNLMGLDKPDEMTGRNLLVTN